MSDDTFVHSDPAEQAGFTIIPNAVVRNPNLSLGAKAVYGAIKSHAWKEDSAIPGQERLARFLGVTPETVRKYTKELVEAKLVKVVRRGQGRTNQYVILPLSSSSSQLPLLLDADARRVLDNDASLEEVNEGGEDEENKTFPAAPKQRERNPVWDALVNVMGFQPGTKSERDDFAKTVREIEAHLPPDSQADEAEAAMLARRRVWVKMYPDAPFTHRVLRGKWTELGMHAGNTNGATNGSALPAAILSPELFREWRRTATRDDMVRYQHEFDVDDHGAPLEGF